MDDQLSLLLDSLDLQEYVLLYRVIAAGKNLIILIWFHYDEYFGLIDVMTTHMFEPNAQNVSSCWVS